MLPILLRFGPIAIYSFGLVLTVAFVVVSFVLWRSARRRGISEEKVLDALLLAVMAGLFVGRLGYIFSHGAVFSVDVSRWVLVFKYPGISLTGALLGGLATYTLAAVGYSLDVLLLLDLLSLALFPGVALGYFGCLLDGCTSRTGIVVILAIIALSTGFFLSWLARKLASSSFLNEISRRHGLFFLAYLIFQLLSLLMLSNGSADRGSLAVYGLSLVGLAALLIYRYQDLFRYFHGTISKFRSRSDQQIS